MFIKRRWLVKIVARVRIRRGDNGEETKAAIEYSGKHDDNDCYNIKGNFTTVRSIEDALLY